MCGNRYVTTITVIPTSDLLFIFINSMIFDTTMGNFKLGKGKVVTIAILEQNVTVVHSSKPTFQKAALYEGHN